MGGEGHARLSLVVAEVVFVVATTCTLEVTGYDYWASNCYLVGGGSLGPRYLKCDGCQYVEAFTCLESLRSNASNNVPQGCGINALTVEPQPECCPIFLNVEDHQSLNMQTSAYPDTLRCLEDQGCGDTALYQSLEEECQFHGCESTSTFSCQSTYSSALPSVSLSARLLVLAQVLVFAAASSLAYS